MFDLADLGIDEEVEEESQNSETDSITAYSFTPDEVEEETQAEQEMDDYMSEVDKRLEVAQFYRALLKNALFGGTRQKGSAATVVEKEVRAFCRTRLAVLMGLKQESEALVAPTVSNVFSEQQTIVLKDIANQLLAKTRTTPIPVVMAATVSAPTVNAVAPSNPQPKQLQKPGPKPGPKPKSNKTSLPPKPLFEEKEVLDAQGLPVLNSKGEPIKIRNQRVQKAAGSVPFPADPSAVTAAKILPQSSNAGAMGRIINHHMKD